MCHVIVAKILSDNRMSNMQAAKQVVHCIPRFLLNCIGGKAINILLSFFLISNVVYQKRRGAQS